MRISKKAATATQAAQELFNKRSAAAKKAWVTIKRNKRVAMRKS